MYLLDCLKCKIQHVGKSETQFNTRLNNHRKNRLKVNSKTTEGRENF